MKRELRMSVFFGVALFSFVCLSGCSHVISRGLLAQVDRYATVSAVQKDPGAYKDKMVLWSGRILNVENSKDGTTTIEVLQQPAGFRGRPEHVDYTEGRFLVRNPGYLDAAIYAQGKDITVAGVVQGTVTRPLGEIEYVYPLVVPREMYLWPEEKEYRPYYGYPYWPYDPYWSPWSPWYRNWP